MDPLARALQHLRCADLDAALEASLAAWARRPSPALASAIRSMSSRVPSGASHTLRGRTPDRQHSWLSLADRAAARDVPALLDTLLKVPPAWALERLERLLRFPADPRIDAWCVTVLEELEPHVPTTRKYLRRHLDLLDRLGDATLLPRIEALPQRWARDLWGGTAAWLREELQLRLVPLRARLAELDSDPGLADALRDALEPELAHTSDTLLSMIYADPARDDVRLVYADALLERGDPRGELILLQYRGGSGARVRQLLTEHGRQWLGPLSHVIRAGFEFERGFLSSCRVSLRRPGLLRELEGHPMWSTVRSLEGSARIGLHPVARSLRELTVEMSDATGREGLTEPWVELLETTERPLTKLVYRTYSHSLRELDLLSRCPALPQLQTLSLLDGHSDVISAILQAPVLARLETLCLAPYSLWHQGAPAIVAALQQAPVPTLQLQLHDSDPIKISLVRSGQRYEQLTATLGHERRAEEFLQVLDLLPHLRQVRVRIGQQPKPTVLDRISAALAERSLEEGRVTP
jgi:uncharacterized protein (TIGR02996 family)